MMYAKLFDNYGQAASNQFMVAKQSSMKQYQLSISPIYLSKVEKSTYFIAVWSVHDAYISEVTSIYSTLLNVGDIDVEDIPKYVINETVMDKGIDVFSWRVSDGKYADQYTNTQPDSTYLMTDYFIVIWSTVSSKNNGNTKYYNN